jgi:hypothetical protein
VWETGQGRYLCQLLLADTWLFRRTVGVELFAVRKIPVMHNLYFEVFFFLFLNFLVIYSKKKIRETSLWLLKFTDDFTNPYQILKSFILNP